jgi:hypothetical protein
MARRKIPGKKEWIAQIFAAKAAKTGGILRRKTTSVQKYASVAALEAEVRRRGFHLVLIKDQYLILCNPGEIKLIF